MSKIDYDLKLIDGVVFDIDGVLSPNCVPMGADGQPQRLVNVKDGYAIQLAHRLGLKIAVISGGNCPPMIERFRYFGIEDVFLKVREKLPKLLEWMKENGLTPEHVAYVGDDIPDIHPMEAVGLGVCPKDAATDVRMIARYISPYDGGQGVARDLIEQVLRAKGIWQIKSEAFLW